MALQKQKSVVFDPSEKSHRDAVKAFLKRRAWSDSPIRFLAASPYGSIADQVTAQLLFWYMEQEEKNAIET